MGKGREGREGKSWAWLRLPPYPPNPLTSQLVEMSPVWRRRSVISGRPYSGGEGRVAKPGVRPIPDKARDSG